MRNLFAFNTKQLIEQPILSEKQLHELFITGVADRSKRLQLDQIGQSYSGLRPTLRRGSGLDYDDSRHYQPGDDLRHINWRQTAKTSQIFTRIFTEEHEPTVILILDRRTPMRFGTRERLKVTRAAELCCYLAGHYQANGFAVGLLLMQQQTQLLKPLNDRRKILEYLHRAVQACPPMIEDDNESSLLAAFTQLQHRGYKGVQLVVMSDFHDLGIEDRDSLAAINRTNSLHFYQVIDPVEVNLPEAGVWMLAGGQLGENIRFDANDVTLRQQYEQQMKAHFSDLEKLCSENRIPYLQVMSEMPQSQTIHMIQHG